MPGGCSPSLTRCFESSSAPSERLARWPPDVALPCPLEPGEYAYRLDLFRSLHRVGPSVSNIDSPDLRLPGKIIVK